MESKAEQKGLVLILAIYALSRIYQLSFGFGLDADAWSLAASAKKIASDWGFYEASRLPGYPIPEQLFALAFKMFGLGFLQANFLAFIFGLLSTIGVWLLSKELGLKPFLPTFAFALHPILLIASAETMDYVFGVFFILWALYFYVKGKLLVSGALLGLACGSRITLAVASVAFILDMIKSRRKGSLVFEWSVAFAFVSALSFAPVFSIYGTQFLSYSHTKIRLFAALYRLLHEFFGVPFVIGFVIVFAIERILRRTAGIKTDKKFILWALFMALWIPYLAFPLDPFYLAGAVGIGILILAIYFSQRAFNALTILILLSSLISLFPIDKHDYRAHKKIRIKIVEAGPALSDALERAALYKKGVDFTERIENLPNKSVYVMGDLFFYVGWNILEKERWENIPFVHQHRLFTSTSPKEFLQRFKSLGWQIFYHDGIYADYQTERAFGYSLEELGAEPVRNK